MAEVICRRGEARTRNCHGAWERRFHFAILSPSVRTYAALTSPVVLATLAVRTPDTVVQEFQCTQNLIKVWRAKAGSTRGVPPNSAWNIASPLFMHSTTILAPNEVIEMNQTPRLGVHPSTIKMDRARARFSAGYKLQRRVMIFHNHKSIAGIAFGLPSEVAACYAGGNRRFVRKSPRGCRLEGT
jgi:hypothetical protein